MEKNILNIITILWLFVLTTSILGCGSAEAIKGYRYPITKDVLEKAVMKVINSNPNIFRDSSKNGMLDSAMKKAEREHSTVDSSIYYNDGKLYVTFKIKVGQIDNDYIIRFYGDEQYRKTSASSEIFITYVRDRYGNALSQGHNENGQFSGKMAKDFIKVFETEFINTLDKELNLNHTDGL